MSVGKNGMSKIRKPLALAAAAGVAISLAAVAAPAQAAGQNVDDVELTWGMNLETGAGAFNGDCNYLSAGKAGNTGTSRAWTEADGFYKSTEGNVSIIKAAAGGGTTAASWATRCMTADGSKVSPMGTDKVSHNQVVFSAGTGTVDPQNNTASISWDGSFTSVFYGGLFYWSASNPTLTVNSDGTATLKATLSGYGASMEDTSVWEPLAPKTATLATLKNVDVTEDGFTVAPEYAGVTLPASFNQVTTGAHAGSFPQDFVEYQLSTGAASYWYSSGGSADARKVATPLSVEYTAEAQEPQEPNEPQPQGEEKDIDLNVQVPETEDPTEPGEPGVFKWEISGASANLGTATQNAAGFLANGSLPTIKVSDQREVTGGWELSGKASAFTAGANSFGAKALGWSPRGEGTTGVVNIGNTIQPGTGNGLSASSVLATATGASEATLNTGIQLLAPANAPAGDYTSTLTVTAIQK